MSGRTSGLSGRTSELSGRTSELEKLIKHHQDLYYNGESEISDAEFDALWDELKSLDPDNPILKKVGADGQTPETEGNFAKVRHLIPMGSQEKAANPEAFAEWAKKHVYDEYLVEYKLDGASLELQYENGTFVRAVTRGDGVIGDDITANAVKMGGLVKNLQKNTGDLFNNETYALTGGVRGEVIMTHEVHDKFFADKANCRNAANGLMKRKNGEGSEYLQIICYDAHFTDGQPFTDEKGKMQWLKDCGFNVSPLVICKSVQEVNDYRSHVMDIRSTIPYDIDGLVIKGNQIDEADMARNRPDKQIAYKFSLEEAVTVIRNVIWSESGATYTPIAEFDAVELAGTTVQKASLSNPNMIKKLDLHIGSHVVVTKRGEIIPKVESLVQNPAGVTPIVQPVVCGVCGTNLVDDGTRLFCPNAGCPKRILHQIQKWINVLDVRDFGENLIIRLFELGRIRSISDLYTLTVGELAELDRMGEKSAAKVIASLNSHRDVTLAQFVAGFDIEGFGEVQIEKLVAAGLNTLELLTAATPEQIAAVYGFADISAGTFVEGIRACSREMFELSSSETIHIKSSAGGRLSGKSFCFTGELVTMKRADAEKLVKENGGTAKSSVTKDLTYLVTNDTSSGSSKNRKAAELGISIINEETFLELLK
ncbi:MAG: NAD-dependent DNA ligase LigA [Spirochaetaceae bacterium]|nr:NAD-dependent DNA ligase LigA [Spirochaetaceae bacterium]